MASHQNRTPSPPPDDVFRAEITAALARVADARLVGRPHTARTSFGEAFDALHAGISVLGNAVRYLAEDALARAGGPRRDDYVLLTPDEINAIWREAVQAEEAIALQGFVQPNTPLGLTERGGGGFGAIEATAAIHDLAQRLAAETDATARADLEAQGCLAFQRLAMRTQRGPGSLPLPDHYDLPQLARIHDDLIAIYTRSKATGRPVAEDEWTTGHEDALGTGPSAFACRAIVKGIAEVERQMGTGHTWAAGTMRAHLGSQSPHRTRKG